MKNKTTTEILEALILKRYNDNIVVLSDLDDKNLATKETMKVRRDLKKNGFKWNSQIQKWFINQDNFTKAKFLIQSLNQDNNEVNNGGIEKIINALEDLEVFTENLSGSNNKKDELKKRIESYIDSLANETDEVKLSEEMGRFLTFTSKLKKRSISNMLLIYIQDPQATHVEGFQSWKSKFNRMVQRGSKGIFIYQPIFKNKKEKELDRDNINPKNDNPVYFKAVAVFDIRFTAVIEGMDDKVVPTPEWYSDVEPDEISNKLIEALKIIFNKHDIKLTNTTAKKGEKGYSADGHINITADVINGSTLSTATHEFAHELMHWKSGSPFFDDATKVIKDNPQMSPNALRELQAESVSYIVLKHFNIPVKHHATYLALWKSSGELIRRNMGILNKVSEYIITDIEETVKEM